MKSILRKAGVGSVLALLIMAMSTTGVNALIINLSTPNLVFDNFSAPFQTPSPTANQSYWWRTLKSGGPTGFSQAENVDCNYDACLAQVNGVAKFTLKPQTYPGSIMVSDLTEERNGYSYNTPHRWLPTVGHPILVTSTMKFSSGYKADGTGAAVGSHPFWLWNNPLGPTGYIAPIQSIGFNWTDGQTFGGFFTGYKATVVDNTVSLNPLYVADLPTVNMNDWFVPSYLWSVDSQGVQNVKFFINLQKVGEYTLTQPMPALTLELSIDNQSAQIGANGYEINFRNPVSEQNMQISSLSIARI
ncbi:MAG: hypothetical protein ABI721_01150 [Candidatus Dojkabacteria bacterium]